MRSESAQSFQNGGRHDRRRFFSFHGNFITFGSHRCVIAVVSSVAGAAAAIVDDEDGEDE